VSVGLTVADDDVDSLDGSDIVDPQVPRSCYHTSSRRNDVPQLSMHLLCNSEVSGVLGSSGFRVCELSRTSL